MKQYGLGPVDGEGGDDDVSAPIDSVVDDPGQRLEEWLRGLMVAVTVGRLHNDVIRFGEDRRVMGQGPGPRADVAGEDDPAAPAGLADHDLDHRRAEDVTGVVVP
ncbi:MAG: hypothetical protein ACYSUF_09995, partial [Planctomycetota bacterium]